MNPNQKVPEFKSFEEFWPFYLSQHSNETCRRLHVLGTVLGLILLTFILFTQTYSLIPFTLVLGYGFSWIGHFVFEKNRPATFIYPRWSFMGDFKMLAFFFSCKLDAELTKLKINKNA